MTYMRPILVLLVLLFAFSCAKNSDSESADKEDRVFPDNAVKGVFSVSDTTEVCFAKGNVRFNAKFNSWEYSEHQYDYIGVQNEHISVCNGNWIDLFGWGTGSKPWTCSCENTDYKDFYDWGQHFGDFGEWQTLSNDEWNYVLFGRQTASGVLFAKASVNDTNGLMLFPDDWEKTLYAVENQNDVTSPYSSNKITAPVWDSVFQSHGVVFLPAAGSRNGKYVSMYKTKGFYWTSSGNKETEAFALSFSGSSVEMKTFDRFYGCSVRLSFFLNDSESRQR